MLFGELHNNPICHWLEFQLAKDLYAQKKAQLVLGAEMFETDNQTALTAYTSGQTTGEEFAKQARLWQNYDTDYRPITDFAREEKIPFVATNIPPKIRQSGSPAGVGGTRYAICRCEETNDSTAPDG